MKGSDRGVNVAEDDAVRDQAGDIRKRLLGGEPFPRLAGEFSVAASKANGGLIGPLKSEELAPALRDLLAKMQVGDITEPIRTQRGYQILKLEASTPNDTLGFEQARERISERVFTDKRKAEFQKYLEKLRSQAIIEWKNEDVRKAFEEGMKMQGTAPSL